MEITQQMVEVFISSQQDIYQNLPHLSRRKLLCKQACFHPTSLNTNNQWFSQLVSINHLICRYKFLYLFIGLGSLSFLGSYTLFPLEDFLSFGFFSSKGFNDPLHIEQILQDLFVLLSLFHFAFVVVSLCFLCKFLFDF